MIDEYARDICGDFVFVIEDNYWSVKLKNLKIDEKLY